MNAHLHISIFTIILRLLPKLVYLRLIQPPPKLDNLHGGAVIMQPIVHVPMLVLHVVILHLLLQNLQFSDPGHRHLVLVRHQGPVKVHRKHHEDHQHRNEHDAR